MRGEGNKAIAFKQCRRIMVRDIRILRGGHFAILATGVDQLTLDNLLVDTNRDGIDIDCCRHVTVSRCHVNAPNDDAIVLKSSFALGKAIITEQVSISHCHVSGYDVGTVFDGSYGRSQQQAPDNDGVTGRIKLGTESNGGFRNITINDCQFERSRGLAIESVDGAIIDNITINNLVMRDVVNAPLFIRLGARLRAPADHPVGSINNIMISNLIATEVDARYASIISGLADHPITNIKLTNISISHGGGGQCRDAERHLAELATAYPEPSMFGITPVHGLFVRHVDNMSVNEMDIHCEQPEQRPALGFYQVTRARIGAIQLSGQHNNQLIAEPLNNASCSINQ
jgi:polygalacturonase